MEQFKSCNSSQTAGNVIYIQSSTSIVYSMVLRLTDLACNLVCLRGIRELENASIATSNATDNRDNNINILDNDHFVQMGAII